MTHEARFVSVTLHEPLKDQVAVATPDRPIAGPPAGTDPAAAPPREAFVVLLEPRQHATYEAVVSLTVGSVLSWRPVPDARVPFTPAECVQCEAVTRADPRAPDIAQEFM